MNGQAVWSGNALHLALLLTAGYAAFGAMGTSGFKPKRLSSQHIPALGANLQAGPIPVRSGHMLCLGRSAGVGLRMVVTGWSLSGNDQCATSRRCGTCGAPIGIGHVVLLCYALFGASTAERVLHAPCTPPCGKLCYVSLHGHYFLPHFRPTLEEEFLP